MQKSHMKLPFLLFLVNISAVIMWCHHFQIMKPNSLTPTVSRNVKVNYFLIISTCIIEMKFFFPFLSLVDWIKRRVCPEVVLNFSYVLLKKN